MTREDLIKKVALKMDEISSSDDVIVSVSAGDNNPLYTQIDSLLNESVNDVLTKAPIYRLTSQVTKDSGDAAVDSTTYSPRKVATISVPTDFIRIASITDSAFKRPITELALEGDDVSNMQSNKFLIAKNSKPVAVLGRDTTSGSRNIKIFSYGEKDTPNPSVYYVKRYDGENLKETISFDDYLIDIVTWACAGRVFAAQGDTSKGQICDNNAVALMI